MVGRLQLVRVVGQGPQHQVSIGAKTTDVVPAADAHSGVENRLLRGRGVGIEQRTRGAEHRIHHVVRGSVDLLGRNQMVARISVHVMRMGHGFAPSADVGGSNVLAL